MTSMKDSVLGITHNMPVVDAYLPASGIKRYEARSDTAAEQRTSLHRIGHETLVTPEERYSLAVLPRHGLRSEPVRRTLAWLS